MILNDKQIIELCEEKDMISPFLKRQIDCQIIDRDTDDERKVLSYGVSSFGYDIRAAHNWKLFSNLNTTIVDPKNFDDNACIAITTNNYDNSIILPPNSFVLTHSVEYIKVPDDIFVLCVGKSTLARCSLVAHITPLEPGWEGHITLEFSNTSSLPVKMYANEGCVQLVFFKGDRPDITYSDREGKYQKQTGITLPKVK